MDRTVDDADTAHAADDSSTLGQTSASCGSVAGNEEQPPLGILHLLTWMTASALYLAVLRSTWLRQTAALNDANVEIAAFSLVMVGLNSIGAGAMIGGVFLLVARRRRGWSFPAHPGEWLLAALGACLLLPLLAQVTVATLWDTFALYGVGTVGSRLLAIAVFSALASRLKGPPRWRWFFWSVVVQETLRFLVACLPSSTLSAAVGYESFVFGFIAQNVIGWLSRVVLVAAVVMDIRSGRRFPWTHWVGVATHLYSGALGVVSLVGFLVFSPWAA